MRLQPSSIVSLTKNGKNHWIGIANIFEFYVLLEQLYQILQLTSINVASKINALETINVKKRQIFAVSQSSDTCPICQGAHKLYTCVTFKSPTVKDRLKRKNFASFALTQGTRTWNDRDVEHTIRSITRCFITNPGKLIRRKIKNQVNPMSLSPTLTSMDSRVKCTVPSCHRKQCSPLPL